MKIAYLLVAILVVTGGCSSDSPTAPVPDPVPQDIIDAVLTDAGKVPPPDPEYHNTTETPGDIVGNYRTVTVTHDDSDNIQDITRLGLNDAVIFPGSLVKGDRIYSYVYDPISVPRAPITLSISLLGAPGAPSISEVVENPGGVAAVRQGISDMVNRVLSGGATAPAQVQWDYKRVHSKSQMSLFVNADIEYAAGEVNTAFDWNTGSDKTRIVAKYQQIYYTVDMNTPPSPGAVFAAGTNEAQLRAAVPMGSLPMYVSSVKYGVMALCAIESDFTEEEMKLALDASYSGAVDVDLGFGRTASEVMTSSSIKVIIYGGSSEGIRDLTTFAGFLDVIQASTTFSPQSLGVPLVYVFRNLRDDTLAQVALTSQYSITRQVKVRQGVRITAERFVCEWSDDDECFADADVDMDRFRVVANAYNRVDGTSPLIQFNPLDQIVFDWSTPGTYEMASGSLFTAGGSIDLVFDTENFDFNYASISLKAFARDYDSCSPSESSWSSPLNVAGGSIFGSKTIMIYNDDFRFRTEVTISPID